MAEERTRFDVPEWLETIADKPLEEQAELVRAKHVEMLTRLNAVKSQIDEHRVTPANKGRYADRDWWTRLNGAKRVLGFQVQRLQDAIGVLNRRIRAGRVNSGADRPKDTHREERAVAHYFMDVAREELDPTVFHKLWGMAEVLKRQNDEKLEQVPAETT